MRAQGLIALAAGVCTMSAAAASPVEPTNEELKTRVAELESRLAALERGTGERWLTEQRAAEIRDLVADVLADADTRSSLLRGPSAGYEDGFVLASGDGNWLLRTNFLMQQRFIINSQESDDQWAFENTRSRFTLSGNVVNPDWFYGVSINVGSNGGGLGGGTPAPGIPADRRTGTLEAYLGYDFGNGFKVWGGSFKDRLFREEIVDASRQLAVERSLIGYVFTTGYVDGVGVEYEAERFRFWGSYNDGVRTSQTVFDVPNTRFSFTARGEYAFEGSWDQFDDLTSFTGDERGILVGGGVHFQTEDDGTPDLDLVTLTIDGSFEFGGGQVIAALMYTDFESGGSSTDMLGLAVQGGYHFTDGWEAFGRFEWADVDAADDITILTLGVNRYFEGHGAKWTTDIGIGFDRVSLAPEVTGFRTDGAGDDGQIVIRSQLQVAF